MARLVPRPAATIALLRDSGDGPQVLMLKRAPSAAFLGGAHVFPGGALDTADTDPRVTSRVVGLPRSEPKIEYWIAAVRECFEEAGILLACDADGRLVSPGHAAGLAAYRNKPFVELLEDHDLCIAAGELAYVGHWITAPHRVRRFDARFFVALAPPGQEGAHDTTETVDSMWITPRQALERGARGEIELVNATQHTLNELKRFSSAAEAMQHVRSLEEIEENRACLALGRDGEKIFRRADPQYHEIHWCDPEETGTTTYDLVPGEPKRLDRWVTRLTAPNPGMMTGPGTNTYLVGEKEHAVIDPGPNIASHVEKILAFGNIRWVLCTHTHGDHSPAAAAIRAASGAKLIGRPAPAGQDATFAPDVVLSHNQKVDIGGVLLRAIHTPGHASNHLCYLLEPTRMLFSGDHVMQGSTVVINPPDGDMRAYLRSLDRLLEEEIAIIAPGHGYLIGAPKKELRRLLAHRLAREEKVREALGRIGPASVDELLPLVYDDVPARIHHVAARSLTAHLDKLVADGTVRASSGRYALVESRLAG